MIGLGVVIGIAAENDVRHHQAGSATLPSYVMPAVFVIVGIGWAIMIALLALWKKRKNDEQAVLGSVRREKAAEEQPAA